MGMLLGSLIGIQIGAVVTKVVPGATIRGFFALSVMAGFVNRLFALPAKLASLEFIPLSKEAGALIDTVGMVIFFVTLSSFAIWVFWTFFTNIRTLRGDDEPSAYEVTEQGT
jgi:hypothetical protein